MRRDQRSLKDGVLAFVEDPGAANYLVELPGALRARGLDCLLAAAGPAREWLRVHGADFLACDSAAAAVDALERLRPRLLVTGTADDPESASLAVGDRARALGIPGVGAVDAYHNAERRFRGLGTDPLAHAPGWLMVPDARTRDAYVALGASPRRVAAVGHPGLERLRVRGRALSPARKAALRARLLPGAPPGVPVLVFAAEIFRTSDPAQYQRSPDYTLHGGGERTGRTEIVLEELLEALAHARPRPYLVLRLHPKNTREEFAGFLARVDEVSQGGAAHDLVQAADCVVGMTTVLLAEAALLGTPTLSLIPRPAERDWLWTVAEGITPCAQTRAEARLAVAALLEGAGAPAADAFAERIGTGSLARMADFLEAGPLRESAGPERNA